MKAVAKIKSSLGTKIVAISFMAISIANALMVLMPGIASADAPSSMNLVVPKTSYNLTFPNADPGQFPNVTCSATFTTTVENDSVIQNSVGSDVGTLKRLVQNGYLGGVYQTHIGAFDSDLTKSMLNYILGNESKTIPILKFQNSSGPALHDGGPFSGTCPSFLIPVSATEWRGGQVPLGDGSYWYIDFKIDTGSYTGTTSKGAMQYYYRDTTNRILAHDDTVWVGQDPDLVMGGTGGNTSIGSLSVNWVNVSEFTVTGGKYAGETYTKSRWDKYSDYYLTAVPKSEDAQRGQMTLSAKTSGGGNVCSLASDCNPNNNSVPFIKVNDESIDFQNHDISGLQNDINKLGSRTAVFYDYDSNGSLLSPQTGDKVVIDGGNNQATQPSNLAYPTIWFAYSAKSDQFIALFTDGDSYESPYLGDVYTNRAANLYRGPGSSSCVGQINTNGDPKKLGQFFEVSWTLYDPSSSTCQVAYGGGTPLKVTAIADESAFTAAQTTDQTNAGSINNNATAPKLSCSILSLNPLNWFLCPIVDGLQAFIGQLDDEINNLLNIDASQIFSHTNDPTQPGYGYYKAWTTFRIFGLGIIVIAGLIAIIAHAFGVELLDAYTIRKVLPRLVIAVIGMSLSWYIMKFLVQFSDDAGMGIRSLIYAPFGGMHNINLSGGSGFSLALITGATAFSLGIVGLLSLALTGALAVLLGFAVLIIRRLLIIMLILLAPLAIALAILPNTKKAWDMWSDTFMRALLMFPIIAAFIASGRVFAATSANSGGTINTLIAFMAYFAPYFLITFAFKLAGGALATIGGMANDRSRGMFDRLKKGRQAIRADRFQRAKNENLWDPNSRVTRALKGNKLATWAVAPHKNLAYSARNTNIPILGREGRRLKASIHDESMKQSYKLRGELNDALGQNDKAYRALYGGWGDFSHETKRRLIDAGMANGTVDENGNVSNFEVADRYKHGLRSEEDFNRMAGILRQSSGTEALAADKVLAARDKISNLYKDGEMNYADVQAAAIMGLASHGFATNEDLAEAGNRLAETHGMEFADSVISQAQVMGAQAGRIDNKNGYGVAIRDGKFVSGTKDFEQGGGGRDIDLIRTFGPQDIANAKGGAFKDLEGTYEYVLSNGRSAQAQADYNTVSKLSGAEKEQMQKTAEGRALLRRAAAYEHYDSVVGQLGQWVSPYSGANIDNRTRAQQILDRHAEAKQQAIGSINPQDALGGGGGGRGGGGGGGTLGGPTMPGGPMPGGPMPGKPF